MAAEPATREGVLALARSAALNVHQRMPEHCRARRVAVSELARDFGVTIKTEPGLQAPARWHRLIDNRPNQRRLWDEQLTAPIDIIFIRPELGDGARRFAVAHELAHVLLHRGDVRPSAPLAVSHEELFANAFAGELLVPMHHRAEARETFRIASTPSDLAALAGSFGASIGILMRLADREQWMEGVDRAWLDIRLRPNRFTGLDVRLRIFDSVLDRRRWFLPGNRSVRGALGGDQWLSTRGRRAGMDGWMDISRWIDGESRRSVHERVRVNVESLRLQRAGADAGVETLAHVAFLSETRDTAVESEGIVPRRDAVRSGIGLGNCD